MIKKVLAGLLTAAMVATLGTMTAFANAGMGIDAAPDASCKWDPHKVICLEEVEAKEYINDGDKVLATLPAGTIIDTDNTILRKGEDTGWADTVVPYTDGGAGTAYFKTSMVQKYDPKTPVEVEQEGERQTLVVRLPETGNEVYEFTVSDPEKIDMLTCEDSKGQFIISFRFITEENANKERIFPSGTIHFVGKVNGNKNHDFTVEIKGDTGTYYLTTIEKPLDFSEINALIDHTEEKYVAAGYTEKVYILKDGRMIDMNGYECVGIADDACQMHDGTIIYDHPVANNNPEAQPDIDSDIVDYSDVLFFENGDVLHVSYLIDGRIVDSNGNELTAFADGGFKMPDGTVVTEWNPAKQSFEDYKAHGRSLEGELVLHRADGSKGEVFLRQEGGGWVSNQGDAFTNNGNGTWTNGTDGTLWK